MTRRKWRKKHALLGLLSVPFIIHFAMLIAPTFIFLMLGDVLVMLVTLQNWSLIWRFSLIAFLALVWYMFENPPKSVKRIEKKLVISLQTLLGASTIIGILAFLHYVGRYSLQEFIDVIEPLVALALIIIPAIYYINKKVESGFFKKRKRR